MCVWDGFGMPGMGWIWAVIAAVAVGLLGYWLGWIRRDSSGGAASNRGAEPFSSVSKPVAAVPPEAGDEERAGDESSVRIEHAFEVLPRLSVEGVARIQLECNAPENSCVVSCRKEQAPGIRIEEVRGGLRILCGGGVGSLSPVGVVVRTTGVPEMFKAAGPCRAEVTGAVGREFACKISGCANLLLPNAKVDEFNLKLCGASRAELSGDFGVARIKAAEAGTVRGSGFFRKLEARVSEASSMELGSVTSAEIDVSGASRAKLAVTGELRGSVSGASTLKYSGKDVEAKVRASDSSRVKRIDPEN